MVDVSVALVIEGDDLEEDEVLLRRIEATHANFKCREHPPVKIFEDICRSWTDCMKMNFHGNHLKL